MLAVIAVVLLAAVLLFVITTSLGDSDSDDGNRGKGGGHAKAENSEGKFYTVEPGDSLTSIADKTGVSVNKLTQLNPDLDPQALISGQRVKLHQ
jgi:LysM repeat protein